MRDIIADYMESGYLENIVDMFEHDRALFYLIGELISDERGRVRLGTAALVEILMEDFYADILAAVPSIAKVLKHPDPTVRGDAAYLLGIIGHKDALPFLSEASDKEEEHEAVMETIKESIKRISS